MSAHNNYISITAQIPSKESTRNDDHTTTATPEVLSVMRY